MLDPFSRGTMVALSALCVAGAVAFAPLRARSSSVLPRLPFALPEPERSASTPAERVMRDPFAEPTPARVSTGASTTAGANVAFSRERDSDVPPGDDALALPGNLPHDVIPALPGAAPDSSIPLTRITAIVTGAHPYAMLESGGVHAIKGIGDRLDGVAITAIDITGVALQNGRRLRVDASGQP